MSNNSGLAEIAFAVCMIAFPRGLFVAFLKFTLSPLSLPAKAKREREREQNLLAGILLLIFGFVIGILIVYILLITAFVQQRKALREFHATDGSGAQLTNLFPRVALEELMCMVFGIASYPILIFGTEFTADKATAVITMSIVGALLYPLCSLAAYNRVNAARVPICAARTVYIALFPLMLFACIFQPMVLMCLYKYNTGPSPFVQLGLGISVTILETIAGVKCARRARAM